MVLTAGGHTFVSFSAGFRHVLAMKSTGEVYSWGAGTANGFGSVKTSPTQIASFGTNAIQISAGNYHNLVLLNNDSIYSFGTGTVSLFVTKICRMVVYVMEALLLVQHLH
jgi:alpha-tubulin suppressor-like RCC1 family protein